MNTAYLVVAVLYLMLAVTKSGVTGGATLRDAVLKPEVLIYGAIAVAYVALSSE